MTKENSVSDTLEAADRYVRQLAPHQTERQGTVLLVALITELRSLRAECEGLKQHISDIETRHAAVMLHTQGVVDECEALREKRLLEPWDLVEGLKKDRQSAIDRWKQEKQRADAACAALAEFQERAIAICRRTTLVPSDTEGRPDVEHDLSAMEIEAAIRALSAPSKERGMEILRDAERYQWLRTEGNVFEFNGNGGCAMTADYDSLDCVYGSDLDAAIDNAMKAKP